MNQTAIIIPNYNGLRFLPDCMAALDRQTKKDFTVLVIDNASTDGSMEWLSQWRAEDSTHRIILRNKTNLGFSAAVNRGIRWAMKHDFSYALLLNNDTEVAEDFVSVLEKEMEKDKKGKLFAISSRMVKFHDPNIIDDAGDGYTVLGWQFQRGLGQPREKWNRKDYVFSACAGAAMYRISALQEIGLFDEMHFAYLEDIDISYRAHIFGYRVKYLPSAVCKHVGSGTSGSKYNSFKVKLSARNSIYLPYKNMPNWQLLLNALPLFLGYFIKYLFFLKKGFSKDYVAGIREGLRNRKHLKRVNFRKHGFLRFLSIEGTLIRETFRYLFMKLFQRKR